MVRVDGRFGGLKGADDVDARGQQLGRLQRRTACRPGERGALLHRAGHGRYQRLFVSEPLVGTSRRTSSVRRASTCVSRRMVNSHLFPPSWGVPPTTQTRDYRVLPGGYGHGSTTMATWIAEKMAADAQGGTVHFPPAWGSPPEAQTRDLRPLPLGYGMVLARFALARPVCRADVSRVAQLSFCCAIARVVGTGFRHIGRMDQRECQRAWRLFRPGAGWPSAVAPEPMATSASLSQALHICENNSQSPLHGLAGGPLP